MPGTPASTAPIPPVPAATRQTPDFGSVPCRAWNDGSPPPGTPHVASVHGPAPPPCAASLPQGTVDASASHRIARTAVFSSSPPPLRAPFPFDRRARPRHAPSMSSEPQASPPELSPVATSAAGPAAPASPSATIEDDFGSEELGERQPSACSLEAGCISCQ